MAIKKKKQTLAEKNSAAKKTNIKPRTSAKTKQALKKPAKKKGRSKRTIAEAPVPYHYKPESMTTSAWQGALRKQFGINQSFKIENTGDHPVYSDFTVFNPGSGNTYKVSIRHQELGYNFCSCPDFKVNQLGTCKHIENVLHRLLKKRGNKVLFNTIYSPAYSSISLFYGAERKVIFRPSLEDEVKIKNLAKGYFDASGVLLEEAFDKIHVFIQNVHTHGLELKVYEDALDFVLREREKRSRRRFADMLVAEDSTMGFLDGLLRVKLLPYQKEGVLFAYKAGRCLIADDMGLGKTIQAIGTAEFMAMHLGVERVLIVCPASLKYQWQSEIKKFTGKQAVVVEGTSATRKKLYGQNGYCIVTYHVAVQDLDVINSSCPDLIVLDESQKIKNWQSQISKAVKKLQSDYAVVLTGTPLENKLEELHSIVEFVDRYKLGPLYRFLESHRIVSDNTAKVLGYKGLNEIRHVLGDIMIRRNKKEVLSQLPVRTDENIIIPMTDEQRIIHDETLEMVKRIAAKWAMQRFLTERDRLRLLSGLGIMRMSCDSTYVVDETTQHGNKVAAIMDILQEVIQEGEKIVIFSQWERMTRLIATHLKANQIGFCNLNGKIPSSKRGDLLNEFKEDDAKVVFLSTDAGGVGLNLQHASYMINVDLPWNPAVLEQRIGRIYRMGQVKPVKVYNLVAAHTIEHRMLDVIAFKKGMFDGVFDGGAESVMVESGKFDKMMETVKEITEPLEKSSTVQELTDSPAPVIAGSTAAVTLEIHEEWKEFMDKGKSLLEAMHTLVKQRKSGKRKTQSDKAKIDAKLYHQQKKQMADLVGEMEKLMAAW